VLELWRSVMADNGAYFLSAYGIVFGGLLIYACWLWSRIGAHSRRTRPQVTARD